jgi:hypothetical protein
LMEPSKLRRPSPARRVLTMIASSPPSAMAPSNADEAIAQARFRAAEEEREKRRRRKLSVFDITRKAKRDEKN